MKELILDFRPDGSVQGLHDDSFSLSFLGSMEISRASEIAFNRATQKWDVVIPGQELPFQECTQFTSYEEARQFEVRWLQSCRVHGYDPVSADGRFAALRTRYDQLY